MTSLPLVIMGLGSVGRALTAQIVQQRSHIRDSYHVDLPVCAVSDSTGLIGTRQPGLTDTELLQICARKEEGLPLAQMEGGRRWTAPTDVVREAAGPGSVVVDCTASDATVPALLLALEEAHGIVLANKKPLTQSGALYQQLTHDTTGAWNLARCRWEATVGAGLPVISTLHRLVSSGDAIARITGTFSGTLGYVMTGLQRGQPFSQVVQEAHAQGYTEPDPRDDLGGVDVARKALILARGMGLPLEMADVTVTGLYPEDLAALSVSEFMAALPTLDQTYQQQCAAAARQDQCLRYVAVVSPDGLAVGPQTVALDSPLGQLAGTDNLVEISSQWYSPQPLVIQGRGAGVEATAAGVLSDIMELAFTRFR